MLRERLKQLAAEYPRYGYELLHGMLKAEGLVVNEKKTYRIYEEKLQVRRKRRKRLLARDRVPMPIPEGANQRWSMDFVSDQLATGRRFRVLNVVDDTAGNASGRSSTSRSLGNASVDSWRMLDRSRPEAIVTDNGPEFTSKAMHLWSQRTGVTLRFIQPGKPTERASRELQRQVPGCVPERTPAQKRVHVIMKALGFSFMLDLLVEGSPRFQKYDNPRIGISESRPQDRSAHPVG